MAPTESEILKHYLLLPAPLTSIQTFEQFRALFPRSWQAHPQVRLLFRDLQAQRNTVINTVTENIDAEARRGVAMRREVLRVALEESKDDDGDAEIEIERALFGTKSGAKRAKYTLHTVIPDLHGAAAAMESEMQRLEDEEADLVAFIRQTIDDLSDLQYGKLSNPQLRMDVLEGLVSLQHACASKT
ncbi:Kinetochore subunit NKP2 [Metarhizium album ARSEF 1941]|uniref:Kinetochore subunit NKP2 n=1 Tax=Metarhizium album (strain ARSEF 1941) TaxID=1081103 RepID=A0A0B2X644_METAS|nr:Kinetochore subunit NKP2 [Metarhizium album ARSEF 1941]KHO01844.1 Kinetochore subunit NKP2 [Metarhizium album ARSEF 1941]